MTISAPVQYFHPLSIIRFLLALGVVVFHFGTDYYPFDLPQVKDAIRHSSFRVSFFFFISGFVMNLVYAGSASVAPRTFFFRRATRIIPLYITGFVITLILLVVFSDAAPKGLVIITHALMLQSLYPGFMLDLNFPSWTLSVELLFYLVFPFLMRGMVRIESRRLIVLCALLWMVQTAQHILFVELVDNGTKPVEEFISGFPLWHLPTFICGMGCALLILRSDRKAGTVKFAGLTVVAGWIALALIVRFSNPLQPYIHNGLLVPVFIMIVAGLYYDRSIIHRLMSAKVLRPLGDLSYAFFIFQYPVWLVCKLLADDSWKRQTSFFYFYLLCLLVVSWAMNRYFEKPFMVWLRKRYSRSHNENSRTVPAVES